MPAKKSSGSALADDDLQAFTKREIMERLRLSERSVDRLLDSGALTTIGPRRRGAVVRVPAASLRAYLYGDARAVDA